MTTISFLHSGDCGDIIASLSTVKEICENEHAKALLFLDTSGGRKLPEDSLGRAVIMRQSYGKGLKFNHANMAFLKPLLEAQPYISRVSEYSGQKIDLDLNLFRMGFFNSDAIQQTGTNLLFLHQLAFNLIPHYEPWLTVLPTQQQPEHDILISRTSRYQSAHLYFAGMEPVFSERGEFIGTDFEYDLYLNAFGYRPRRFPIADSLAAAQAIASSKTFVSNGTVFYWIALGLGHPRIIHELGEGIDTTLFRIPEPRVYFVKGGTIRTCNPELAKSPMI